jgi:hypothetical protein
MTANDQFLEGLDLPLDGLGFAGIEALPGRLGYQGVQNGRALGQYALAVGVVRHRGAPIPPTPSPRRGESGAGHCAPPSTARADALLAAASPMGRHPTRAKDTMKRGGVRRMAQLTTSANGLIRSSSAFNTAG